MIRDNLNFIKNNIETACKNSNRELTSVTLIAVSKTKPVELLQEVYNCGCRDFGENKVQEILEKYDKLPKDIRWHMIGHLQTNKVKYIIDKVSCIHSVDSYHLAEVISKEAIKKDIVMPILIEVNIAEEKSKFGTTKEDTISLVKKIAALPNVQIMGLMTIAPYVDESEENRQYFVSLRDLSVDIMSENIDNVCMNELSMGMTGDYVVAIEEGSTYVRVGTGIFGERQYT